MTFGPTCETVWPASRGAGRAPERLDMQGPFVGEEKLDPVCALCPACKAAGRRWSPVAILADKSVACGRDCGWTAPASWRGE